MIIRIEKRDNPYAQIDRRALEDDRLSFKAKGVLAYLLSRPSDWNVRMHDLASRSTDGMASVQSAMKELQKFGYASFVVTTDPVTKQITGSLWTVRETPTTDKPIENIESEPQVDFPHAENPHCGKAARGKVPCLEDKKNTNKNLTNKELTKEPVFPGVLDCDEFKTAWGEYLTYRQERRLQKLQDKSISRQFKQLATWGLKGALESIDATIRNGWQGLFIPKNIKPEVDMSKRIYTPPANSTEEEKIIF